MDTHTDTQTHRHMCTCTHMYPHKEILHLLQLVQFQISWTLVLKLIACSFKSNDEAVCGVHDHLKREMCAPPSVFICTSSQQYPQTWSNHQNGISWCRVHYRCVHSSWSTAEDNQQIWLSHHMYLFLHLVLWTPPTHTHQLQNSAENTDPNISLCINGSVTPAHSHTKVWSLVWLWAGAGRQEQQYKWTTTETRRGGKRWCSISHNN